VTARDLSLQEASSQFARGGRDYGLSSPLVVARICPVVRCAPFWHIRDSRWSLTRKIPITLAGVENLPRGGYEIRTSSLVNVKGKAGKGGGAPGGGGEDA